MPPVGVFLLLACLLLLPASAVLPVCGELANNMADLPMTSTFYTVGNHLGQRFEVTSAVTVANFSMYLYGMYLPKPLQHNQELMKQILAFHWLTLCNRDLLRRCRGRFWPG
jgi:hypothetical protein